MNTVIDNTKYNTLYNENKDLFDLNLMIYLFIVYLKKNQIMEKYIKEKEKN